jgi:hypothetical protein
MFFKTGSSLRTDIAIFDSKRLFGLQCVIRAPQQRHQRLNALAALSATATGGVDAAWLARAGGRGSLLHLAIGQRVAKADIHSGWVLPTAELQPPTGW